MMRHPSKDSEGNNDTMNSNTSNRDSIAPRRWFRDNAKVLFFAALLVSLITLLGASVQMLQIAFDSQPECVTHSRSINDASTSHRAAKSSC